MSNEKHIIELVDKYSDPLRKVTAATDRFEDKVDKVTRSFGDQRRSIGMLREQMDRYRRLRDESFRSDHIRKYNQLIGETQRRMNALSGSTDQLAAKTSKWQSVAARAIGAYVGVQGLRMAGRGVMNNINAYGQVEKYEATLETMLGSKGAARDRMQEYMKIAATTPFQIGDVVEGGNKLQSIGRYSGDNLRMLGDLGAASGKGIDQSIEAYTKLAMGQKGEAVKQFRNLLISNEDWATHTGTQIDKSGNITATTEQMLQALPAIMKAKNFMGMMEKQSQTTEGRVSNLNDSLFQLKVAAGERMAPAFNSLVVGSTKVTNAMKSWVEIPLEQKLQSEITKLKTLEFQLRDTNTSEERRKAILEEMRRINPDIVKGIDDQAINYEKLSGNIQKVIEGLKEQIFWVRAEKRIAKEQEKLDRASNTNVMRGEELAETLLKYGYAENMPVGTSIRDEAARALRDFQAAGGAAPTSIDRHGREVASREQRAYREIRAAISAYNSWQNNETAMTGALAEEKEKIDKWAAALGYSKQPGATGAPGSSPGSLLDGDSALATNINQLSGSPGAIRNITLNIGSMIETNNNIFEQAFDADPERFMDKLRVALISVLNDVNNIN
jgi:hypothetical protein